MTPTQPIEARLLELARTLPDPADRVACAMGAAALEHLRDLDTIAIARYAGAKLAATP